MGQHGLLPLTSTCLSGKHTTTSFLRYLQNKILNKYQIHNIRSANDSSHTGTRFFHFKLWVQYSTQTDRQTQLLPYTVRYRLSYHTTHNGISNCCITGVSDSKATTKLFRFLQCHKVNFLKSNFTSLQALWYCLTFLYLYAALLPRCYPHQQY